VCVCVCVCAPEHFICRQFILLSTLQESWSECKRAGMLSGEEVVCVPVDVSVGRGEKISEMEYKEGGHLEAWWRFVRP